MDHFAGAAADNMDAENLVRLGIGEKLDEPVRGIHRPRAAIGGEREFAALVLNPGVLQFLGRYTFDSHLYELSFPGMDGSSNTPARTRKLSNRQAA